MRYPEQVAGGFTRVDGAIEFFTRVHALLADLPDGTVVLDFGAGRGKQALLDPSPYRRRLQDLRAPGRTVIGADVDPIVTTNPQVDRALVIGPDGRIDLPDGSIDVVVSEFTFEHVDDPSAVAAELHRIVRPGGWVCARTPNKWGYIAIGARLVPNRLHIAALARLQPGKAAQDTFPTRYRMNTVRALRSVFGPPRWEVFAYAADAEPDLYTGSSHLLSSVIAGLHHLPGPVRSMLFVFIQKAPGA
jgi:SAM-dependent methyltransferase